MPTPEPLDEIDLSPIRRQISARYVAGVPGSPSYDWRVGASWALDQCEMLIKRHRAGATKRSSTTRGQSHEG